METLNKESALEAFMQDDDSLEQEPVVSHHFSKGAVLIAGTLVALIAVAAVLIAGLVNAVNAKQEARQETMNAIAGQIPAPSGWAEVSSSSPSLDKVFNKTWKTETPVNLDEVAKRLNIPMSDMAYPAGCKEGNSGEFYIQLCSANMGKTVSVIID